MSLIFYKNEINPDNINSIAVSTTSGSITERLDINNLADRSILKRYEYSNSSVSGSVTITFTFDDVIESLTCCALLACYRFIETAENLRIIFKNTGGGTIYTTTTETSSRTRRLAGETVRDTAWKFAEINNVKSIEIFYDKEVGLDSPFTTFPFIGTFYAGSLIDLNVSPNSLKYSFVSQGSKVKTEGGQIIASQNNSYMKASFSSTATKETSVVSNYFDLNYESSVSEPIIFIPQEGGNIMLYGTQLKANETRTLLGKEDGEWLYETQFQIEEEL